MIDKRRCGEIARRAGAFAAAAMLLVPGACSSGGSGSSNGAATSADAACTATAQATCTKMQTCTPANVESTYGSEAACEARLKASCLDELAAPSTGATPDSMLQCAHAYPTLACSDYRDKTNIPASCLPAAGKLSAGAPCLYGAQCQSAFCAIVPGNECGTCADPPKAGDSCAQLTTCGPTLTCTSDTLVCATFAAAGAACGPGQPCGAGLTCVAPGGAGTAGTCQTAGSHVGDICDPAAKTGAGCDGALDLHCDAVTKSCAQTTYAAAGQACGYSVDAGTLVQCTAGRCVGSDPAALQSGSCMGRTADDESCTVPDGGAATPSAGCLPPARCLAGTSTCVVPVASSCH